MPGNLTLAAKRDAAVGWEIRENAGTLILTLQDEDGSVDVVSAALTASCWHYAECYVDRSGSAQWFVNGVASGDAVDISATEKTLTNTESLTIGADSGGADEYTSHIAYLAMWTSASWLDTHTQTAVAKERFMRVTGVAASVAIGSKVPTFTRATAALLDRVSSGVTTYYYVGIGWPRVCGRATSGGVGYRGYLAETASTNNVTNSSDIATWDNYDSVTFGSDVIQSPIQGVLFDSVIESTDDAAKPHRASSPLLSWVTDSVYAISFIVKVADRGWIHLSANGGNITAYIDLTTPAWGTVSDSIGQKEIFDLGGGWYRVRMAATAGATGSSALGFFPCVVNGSVNYQGNGSTAFYLGAVQHEANICGYSTSPIITTSGAVTRNADVLTYDAGNIPVAGDAARGRASACIFMPALNATVADKTILGFNDGGAATDVVELCVNTSNGLSLRSAASGATSGDANGTTSVMTRASVLASASWATDALRVSVNGVSDATENDGDIPDDLDRITVGSGAESTKQLNGLVSDLRIERY